MAGSDSSAHRYLKIIDAISRRTNGRMLLTIAEYSKIFGTPEQTIRNKIHNKSWLIPLSRDSGRIHMLATDIATVLAGDRDLLRLQRRRGRPRKATPLSVPPSTPKKGE